MDLNPFPSPSRRRNNLVRDSILLPTSEAFGTAARLNHPSITHGNRGPGRTPLDWTRRLKITAGAARGIVFIHNSSNTLKLIHGNIKSTNILIDGAGNARVSDFGLSAFASPSSAHTFNNYRAPKTVLDGRKMTQKSDVYSFGVLLLELLTGKCPSMIDGGGSPGPRYGSVVDLPRWVQSVVREEWTAVHYGPKSEAFVRNHSNGDKCSSLLTIED